MALTFLKYAGVIHLRDRGGNHAFKEYDLREATTYADALTDMAAIVALLVPITNARVQDYYVKTVISEDAFAFPTGDSQVENVARIVALLDSDEVGKTVNIEVPAPVDGLFMGSAGKPYNIVDVGDSALFAYTDGVYATTGGLAYISDGETIADTNALVSGKRIHKKSNNG
jgi:hypothetical protein